MRIQNSNGTVGVSKNRSARKSNGSGSQFSLPEEEGAASGAQQASQSGLVQDVGSLLALQSVEDSLQGNGAKKRKVARQGNNILDLLDELRLGLLSGSMPRSVLGRLDRLASNYEKSGDARIDGVMDEISLRAQVELAKLEAERRT